MSTNCDVIVIFPVYDQFVAILKSKSGFIIRKTYSFIKSNLQKVETKLKNLYHSFHTIALSKGTIFPKKMLIFCKKCWH